jgi:hypothetical protein
MASPSRWLQVPGFVLALACSSTQARPSPAGGEASSSAQAPAQSSAHPPLPGSETGRTIRFGDSASGVTSPPIFEGTTYDPNVPSPDSLLRQPLGTFTAHHAEIMAAMRAMEAKSAARMPRSRSRTTSRRARAPTSSTC